MGTCDPSSPCAIALLVPSPPTLLDHAVIAFGDGFLGQLGAMAWSFNGAQVQLCVQSFFHAGRDRRDARCLLLPRTRVVDHHRIHGAEGMVSEALIIRSLNCWMAGLQVALSTLILRSGPTVESVASVVVPMIRSPSNCNWLVALVMLYKPLLVQMA